MHAGNKVKSGNNTKSKVNIVLKSLETVVSYVCNWLSGVDIGLMFAYLGKRRVS